MAKLSTFKINNKWNTLKKKNWTKFNLKDIN